MILEQKEIRYRGKVVFERLVMSASFKRAPKFFLEDEACFLFLTKGAFQFRTPTNLLRFSEGDGMLAQCGNYLIERMSVKQGLPAETVSVVGAFFYPDMIKGYFENDLSLEPFQKPVTVSKVDIDPMIRSLMDSLNYLIDNPSVADENLVVTKQKELLILLSKSEGAHSVTEFINALFAPNEYDFREVVEKNVFTDLKIAELALLCGMSEATFKRKFNTIFNQSPARYILARKLEYAQTLLQIPSKTISDIAYECGFSSPPSFSKIFKKHTGLSPSTFRKNQMGNYLS